jgi:hypothetical protein
MIEIEGMVAEILGAEQLDHTNFKFHLVLSPWSETGGEPETTRIEVTIPMDMDLVDGWLQMLRAGHLVQIICESIAADRSHALGTQIDTLG